MGIWNKKLILEQIDTFISHYYNEEMDEIWGTTFEGIKDYLYFKFENEMEGNPGWSEYSLPDKLAESFLNNINSYDSVIKKYVLEIQKELSDEEVVEDENEQN